MISSRTHKIISLVVISLLIVLASISFYNPIEKLYASLRSHSYVQAYLQFNDIEVKPVSEEPAIAVPVLMYHGVVTLSELGDNTKRRNFIKQMEMLKREGYETISVREYDLFREGLFTLPPKPIIITFDDGRKDSFYTVDEVLRKLGFSATMFVATVKANAVDSFYLDWEELSTLQQTGRWEIEAHGRHSHDKVIINEAGDEGRYLSSRMYDAERGLETESEYEARVHSDYLAGLNDIRQNLGFEPTYFAVPLNDYGFEASNHGTAYDFNKYLTELYFKLAFVQSLSDNGEAYESFYNYADSDPHTLKRLEVKNMTAEQLRVALEKFAPSEPSLVFPEYTSAAEIWNHTYTPFGTLLTTDTELLITPGEESHSALTVFGDTGWNDYEFTTHLNAADASDSRIYVYYTDSQNFVQIAINDGILRVTERIDSLDTVHATASLPATSNPAALEVAVSIFDGVLTVRVNDTVLVREVAISLTRGAPALGVWDPEGDGLIVWHFSVISLKPVQEMLWWISAASLWRILSSISR